MGLRPGTPQEGDSYRSKVLHMMEQHKIDFEDIQFRPADERARRDADKLINHMSACFQASQADLKGATSRPHTQADACARAARTSYTGS